MYTKLINILFVNIQSRSLQCVIITHLILRGDNRKITQYIILNHFQEVIQSNHCLKITEISTTEWHILETIYSGILYPFLIMSKDIYYSLNSEENYAILNLTTRNCSNLSKWYMLLSLESVTILPIERILIIACVMAHRHSCRCQTI